MGPLRRRRLIPSFRGLGHSDIGQHVAVRQSKGPEMIRNIIYIIGLIVVVLIILSLLGVT